MLRYTKKLSVIGLTALLCACNGNSELGNQAGADTTRSVTTADTASAYTFSVVASDSAVLDNDLQAAIQNNSEAMALSLNNAITLPNSDVRINLQDCDGEETTAQYEPADSNINICYNLFEDLANDETASSDDVLNVFNFIVNNEISNALMDQFNLPELTDGNNQTSDILNTVVSVILGGGADDEGTTNQLNNLLSLGGELLNGDLGNLVNWDGRFEISPESLLNMTCLAFGVADQIIGDESILSQVMSSGRDCGAEYNEEAEQFEFSLGSFLKITVKP